MKYAVNLVLLAATAGITCGFSWGFGHSDTCGEANKLIPAVTGSGGGDRTKQEQRILDLCPDGAAGHFVLGLRLFRWS